MPGPHFYYPSGIIACGGTVEDHKAPDMTCIRSEVKCQGCLDELEKAKARCARCRGEAAVQHTCDPGDH